MGTGQQPWLPLCFSPHLGGTGAELSPPFPGYMTLCLAQALLSVTVKSWASYFPSLSLNFLIRKLGKSHLLLEFLEDLMSLNEHNVCHIRVQQKQLFK